jgi:hypothetical protein
MVDLKLKKANFRQPEKAMTTGSMAGAMPAATMAGEDNPKREFVREPGRVKYSKAIKANHVGHASKLQNAIYNPMETAVLNGWKSLQRAVVAEANKIEKSSIVIRKDYVEQVLGIMDTETLKMMEDLVGVTDKQAASILAAEQGRTGRVMDADKKAAVQGRISAKAKNTLGKSIESINGTIKTRVRSVLETGLDEEKTTAQIADDINAVFESEDYGHAKTIARTETTKFVNGARMEALSGMGFGKKVWFHSGHIDPRDGRPDGHGPNHLALDGIEIPMADPWTDPGNGHKLMFPGDPAAEAEDVVNCGCTFSESVADAEEE